jgi:hypothetical protein
MAPQTLATESEFFRWASLSKEHRQEIAAYLHAFSLAPKKGMTQWFTNQAEALCISTYALRRKYYAWINGGRDWKTLIDQRTEVGPIHSRTSNGNPITL